MNVENILKVADAIEQHSIPDLGFNMGVWYRSNDDAENDLSGHGCGTIACVGGWSEIVLLHTLGHNEKSVRDELGISYSQGEELFYGEGLEINATPAQAVRTLRHLAATGIVDWDLPEPVEA